MVNSSWGDHAKGGNRFVAFDKITGDVRWWSEPAGAVKGTYYSVPVTARMPTPEMGLLEEPIRPAM